MRDSPESGDVPGTLKIELPAGTPDVNIQIRDDCFSEPKGQKSLTAITRHVAELGRALGTSHVENSWSSTSIL